MQSVQSLTFVNFKIAGAPRCTGFAGELEFAAELVNPEAPADAGPSTELILVQVPSVLHRWRRWMPKSSQS